MDYSKIRVSDDGPIRTITLAFPERKNAIGPAMTGEILSALEAAASDGAVRVVVLTGEGKAFSAGGDFNGMDGGPAEAMNRYATLLRTLLRFEKPVIAKVNGIALGGGLGLVAASSFAIAADSAELGTPEVNVGLFPMMIMAVLARLMPRRRLLQMMLLGEKLPAQEALRVGLVGEVVRAEELDAAVSKLALSLAGKSPTAIRLGLHAFAEQDDLALDEALPKLAAHLATCLQTEDAREGLMAFLEKRPAVWTGR